MAAELERDTVEIRAEEHARPNVLFAHQEQRHEEVLTELPVRHPRRAFNSGLKREGVDEERTAVTELHVVGAGVPEHEVARKGAILDRERQERCVLELAERPFIGVGDERNPLGLEHRARLGRRGVVERRLVVRNEESVVRQLTIQTRRQEGVERGFERSVDLAVNDAVAGEDEPAGIAERAVYRLPIHRWWPGRSDRKKDLVASRTRENMARSERTPAAINWRTRLPAVGSMYMRGLGVP